MSPLHIGESMTGAGGKVVRDLNLTDEMYRRKYPTKQGVKVYGQQREGLVVRPGDGPRRELAALQLGHLAGPPQRVRQDDARRGDLPRRRVHGSAGNRADHGRRRRGEGRQGAPAQRQDRGHLQRPAARLLGPGDLPRQPSGITGPSTWAPTTSRSRSSRRSKGSSATTADDAPTCTPTTPTSSTRRSTTGRGRSRRPRGHERRRRHPGWPTSGKEESRRQTSTGASCTS